MMLWPLPLTQVSTQYVFIKADYAHIVMGQLNRKAIARGLGVSRVRRSRNRAAIITGIY